MIIEAIKMNLELLQVPNIQLNAIDIEYRMLAVILSTNPTSREEADPKNR